VKKCEKRENQGSNRGCLRLALFAMGLSLLARAALGMSGLVLVGPLFGLTALAVVLALLWFLIAGAVIGILHFLLWLYAQCRSPSKGSRQRALGTRHSKPIPLGTTVAHRGGREFTPENTLSAFRNSIQHVDAIELDLWLTRDERVVVLHDGNFNRVCGIRGHVTETNYEDLPKVKRWASDGFDQGSHNDTLPEVEPIPLFEEILELLTEDGVQTKMIVEIKMNSKLLMEKVRDLLHEKKLIEQERVYWFSLNRKINHALFTVDKMIPRGPSVVDVFITGVAYRVGLLTLLDPDYDAYCLVTETPEELLVFLRKVPFLMLLPRSTQLWITTSYLNMIMNPDLFETLRKRGIECWVLSINSEADIELGQRLGATTFISDRPEWISEVFKGHNHDDNKPQIEN